MTKEAKITLPKRIPGEILFVSLLVALLLFMVVPVVMQSTVADSAIPMPPAKPKAPDMSDLYTPRMK